LTPREWDGTKILTYNKNILAAAMAPNTNGFELSVFDFFGRRSRQSQKTLSRVMAMLPTLCT
jgi:hypothetical protein